MSTTEIKSSQIKDGEVKRADLNTATSGSAVVRKLVAGTGITLDSTGADAGTGDVTVNATGGTAGGSTGQVQYNNAGSLAGDTGFVFDPTNNYVGIGVGTPTTDLMITKSVGLDGSNPAVITLHSTNNSGSWTAGARVASLDYYSDDLSGTGNTPGVRNRIAFESAGTTGGAYDFNLYGDSGSGLYTQLKFTKDGFCQINGNTASAGLAVRTYSTNVSSCVVDGIASQTQNIFRVRDGSSNALFDIGTDGKVGIGNATPAKILDVTSTTSGVLVPRMTTTQRDAVSSPTTSELIYNSTTARFERYSGSAWVPLGSGNVVGGADSVLANQISTTSTTHGTTGMAIDYTAIDATNDRYIGYFANYELSRAGSNCRGEVQLQYSANGSSWSALESTLIDTSAGGASSSRIIGALGKEYLHQASDSTPQYRIMYKVNGGTASETLTLFANSSSYLRVREMSDN